MTIYDKLKGTSVDSLMVALKIMEDYKEYTGSKFNLHLDPSDVAVKLFHLFSLYMNDMKVFLNGIDCSIERMKYLEAFEILSDIAYDKMEQDITKEN